MSDPRITPPPATPLPEATKDRIRAELVAATQTARGGARLASPSRSRWVAPGLAAASVLALVGGIFAVSADSGDSPAGHLTSAGRPSTSAGLTGTGTSASPPAGPTRPHQSEPKAPPKGFRDYKVQSRKYALREKLVRSPNGSIVSDHFLAGGRAGDAVRAITYTFPDGHDVPVMIGAHGVWSVNYSPTSGQLLDPNVDRITLLDPPWAAVRYSNGYVDRFPLRWPRASCRISNAPLHLC